MSTEPTEYSEMQLSGFRFNQTPVLKINLKFEILSLNLFNILLSTIQKNQANRFIEPILPNLNVVADIKMVSTYLEQVPKFSQVDPQVSISGSGNWPSSVVVF